ncbi:hypothetical protein ABZ605_10870 [Streptomyces sp. NPDC012765]|uniref:hypothetical protein n=1 Tax=Streptomyces sp. NPDC012765 TaxID=3155249 RepID=UPI0033DBEF06
MADGMFVDTNVCAFGASLMMLDRALPLLASAPSLQQAVEVFRSLNTQLRQVDTTAFAERELWWPRVLDDIRHTLNFRSQRLSSAPTRPAPSRWRRQPPGRGPSQRTENRPVRARSEGGASATSSHHCSRWPRTRERCTSSLKVPSIHRVAPGKSSPSHSP